MIVISSAEYHKIHDILAAANDVISTITMLDHLGGFDPWFRNDLLAAANEFACDRAQSITVQVSYIPDPCFTQHYPWLKFKFDLYRSWQQFRDYHIHPKLTFQNFVCSFNGSNHVSRKLLTSALNRFRWFDTRYCSKNFSFSNEELDGHVADFTDGVLGQQHVFYRKFFLDDNQSQNFAMSTVDIDYERYDHRANIKKLESRLSDSFLHVVSETMATSSYPIVSEKFLYSVVTRGLFLSYAQPNWHDSLETHFGFRKYTKLFDYTFDTVSNPVERLITLLSMLAKFSVLSRDDWQDLYELETETIEFNYEHYFSQGYIRHLKQFCKT